MRIASARFNLVPVKPFTFLGGAERIAHTVSQGLSTAALQLQ
jgi:hypothetical protein